jgi:hypothetical protein
VGVEMDMVGFRLVDALLCSWICRGVQFGLIGGCQRRLILGVLDVLKELHIGTNAVMQMQMTPPCMYV